jgi:hypothetical protein
MRIFVATLTAMVAVLATIIALKNAGGFVALRAGIF